MTPPTLASTSTPPFAPAVSSARPRLDRALPRPLTFEERFCTHHRCDAEEFRRTVFWHSIPRRVRPLASAVWFCRRAYFSRDQRFIDELAKARCIDDVQLDAHDYRHDPANRRWARRTLGLRLSCTRVVELARGYLPQRYGAMMGR